MLLLLLLIVQRITSRCSHGVDHATRQLVAHWLLLLLLLLPRRAPASAALTLLRQHGKSVVATSIPVCLRSRQIQLALPLLLSLLLQFTALSRARLQTIGVRSGDRRSSCRR